LSQLSALVSKAMERRTAISGLIPARPFRMRDKVLRLTKTLGSTAGFWLRLQLNYDLARIQKQRGKIHARRLGTPAELAS
jgi:plasmid maintenance system antidote protein VapI